MENLSLIAAIGRNNELGRDNKLIWIIKEDLAFYRKYTIHENIIMGRKTLESMPSKALEERNVFVLSSQKLDAYYDVNSHTDIEELLKYIEINPDKHFIVVGGAQIYREFMPYVDTMYLTEIDEYAAADTFFPEIDMDDWDIETIYYNNERDYLDRNQIPYVRNRYVRKRVK